MNAEVTHFTPNPDTTRQLRSAFSRFATGVTVVTAASDDGPLGMTVNSFSSLSLDPALVLWSPAQASGRYKYFAHATHFNIHILSDEQKHICEAFAKNAWSFEGIDCDLNPYGVPVFKNCLAHFECKHFATHPGGDHSIVVGQVLSAQLRDGNPLAFYAGGYGSLQTE